VWQQLSGNKKATKFELDVIRPVKQLLMVDDRVQFVHKSMVDWLTDTSGEKPSASKSDVRLYIDVDEESHEALSEWALEHSAKTTKSPAAFAYQNVIYHLRECAKYQDIDELVQDISWLLRSFENGYTCDLSSQDTLEYLRPS
jgi:hypothetical protein